MAEPISPQSVNVNDCDFAYITQGSGDAIIFVHGSVNDYRSWRNQMSPFADRTRLSPTAAAITGPTHNPKKGRPTKSSGMPPILAR